MSVRINLEIGHEASIRSKRTTEGFTHDWVIFVRGCDGADIQYYVEKVVFYLHDTFHKPKRVIKSPPYTVKESGYAGFNLPIEIYLKNEEEPKKIRFNYDLNLQPTGPPIIKVQKEKYVFVAPTSEFKSCLLKGGGIIVNTGDTIENRSNDEGKTQMTNKPKLSGMDVMKKHKVKIEEPRIPDSFHELFGPPITKTTKISPDVKNVAKDANKSAIKLEKGEKDKTKSKHGSYKDKDKSKDKGDSERKSREDKKKDKDRSKERDSNKEKSIKHEKSPTPRSSSPKSFPWVRRSTSPKRPSSPPLKHKEKEDKKPESKEGKEKSTDAEKKSKKEKREKDKEHKENKHKEREFQKPVEPKEKKETKPSKSTKEKEQSVSPKIEKKEKTREKETVKEPTKEPEPIEKPRSEKSDEKPKHKHKKKDKERKEKKSEKDKTKWEKKSPAKQVENNKEMQKDIEKPVKTEPVIEEKPKEKPKKPLNNLITACSPDSSNSPMSSGGRASPIEVKQEPPKMEPPPVAEPKKSKSNSDKTKPKKEKTKKGKDKKSDKPEKKRKRKTDVVPEEEPPEKIMKDDSNSEVEQTTIPQKEVDKENQENPEDYMQILRDLQHKIMTLQDNAELQKVVELIADTGRFEVSARTFDFDLCLLERSTVRQLQEFFSGGT